METWTDSKAGVWRGKLGNMGSDPSEGDKWTHCVSCARPTRMTGTRLCDQCWEFRRRGPENGWHLIETAPKDNKRLLYLARFVDGQLSDIDFDGCWDEIIEEPGYPTCYGWRSAYGRIEEPTHWAYQEGPPPEVKP